MKSPRQWQEWKPPVVLIEELMQKVRRDLYTGTTHKKYWFSQQALVKKALYYPAVCLNRYQVEIPAARYQAILEGIIDTAAQHGNLSAVGYMSSYFFHCVQEHWKHHGDKYYAEGRDIRNGIGLAMTALERAQRGADGTVPTLAKAAQDEQAAQVARIGKRKGKPKDQKNDQPSLL